MVEIVADQVRLSKLRGDHQGAAALTRDLLPYGGQNTCRRTFGFRDVNVRKVETAAWALSAAKRLVPLVDWTCH
jgi:hypothetical protein